jgi:hypothetical protein
MRKDKNTVNAKKILPLRANLNRPKLEGGVPVGLTKLAHMCHLKQPDRKCPGSARKDDLDAGAESFAWSPSELPLDGTS